MSNIEIFKNPKFGSVRSLEINSEPWFVGKDIAEALWYSDTNKAVAMHVDDDDKKLKVKMTPSLGSAEHGSSMSQGCIHWFFHLNPLKPRSSSTGLHWKGARHK